jgi:hypothetical protein
MDGTRIAALLAAVIGVMFLGHSLYTTFQGDAAELSLLLGVAFAGMAVFIRRRAPRT